MFDSKFFDDIAKRLAENLPESAKVLREDAEKHFRHILQTWFAKLDLVTREEFDIQALVLSKTRAKVEKLTEQVELLLQKLEDQPPSSHRAATGSK